MKELFGKLWMLGWQIAAFALVVFILWYALRLNSHMWRQVAARYHGKPASTAIASKLETIVIAARDMRMPNPLRNPMYRQYPGVILAVYDEGLALKLVPPFNIHCPPLFLPFGEMEVEQTYWALWPEPFAIRMRQLPDVDIIVGRDTVRWLRGHIDRAPFGLGV